MITIGLYKRRRIKLNKIMLTTTIKISLGLEYLILPKRPTERFKLSPQK